jgi:hypothetical protein
MCAPADRAPALCLSFRSLGGLINPKTTVIAKEPPRATEAI